MFYTNNVTIVGLIFKGRLVRVKDGNVNWGWGVVVNFQKKTNPSDRVKKNTSLAIVGLVKLFIINRDIFFLFC